MNSKPIDKNLEIFIHGWSGAIAGAVSTLMLYPMENLKTRLQTNKQNKSMYQIVKQVYKNEDIIGFYKGMTPMLIGNFISYGIYFFWYQFFKDLMKIQNGDNVGYLKASFLSGIITTIGTNPFWVVQTRMILGHENFIQTVEKMFKNEGINSLFRGLSASLILVINPIIQFIAYEYLKARLSQSQIIKSKFLLFFICGAISKAIATFITYPYQVIRTFQHIDKNKKFLSISDILKSIYQQQGFSGFFKGLTPKLQQTVLNSAFMLAFYEKIVNQITQIFLILFKLKQTQK
uniref:Mitochondrial carrier protein, putative n=1 Tax=Ichthyophthirius multifiliis TaxID=5932 RepID=G0QL39_ICHMU|nr:mitochondrial carrier protein, putative [Ichthyophthirius multifiliis]EGR34064.1 mitochondrial carrier protein, putative [Ichthyophthirius multifiliis]|eukprot:XP_004039368.1 mitochondrial carrier protein, putative [Ichthyophthirius multifiliis]